MKDTEQKPSVLLWFMSRFTFMVLPLSLVILIILNSIGMATSLVTVLIAGIIGNILVKQYENIHVEMIDYIRKEQNKGNR